MYALVCCRLTWCKGEISDVCIIGIRLPLVLLFCVQSSFCNVRAFVCATVHLCLQYGYEDFLSRLIADACGKHYWWFGVVV